MWQLHLGQTDKSTLVRLTNLPWSDWQIHLGQTGKSNSVRQANPTRSDRQIQRGQTDKSHSTIRKIQPRSTYSNWPKRASYTVYTQVHTLASLRPQLDWQATVHLGLTDHSTSTWLTLRMCPSVTTEIVATSCLEAEEDVRPEARPLNREAFKHKFTFHTVLGIRICIESGAWWIWVCIPNTDPDPHM